MEAARRLAEVRERLAAAAARSGRAPEAVRLVAVTKSVDAERVRELVAAGVTELGENRVQEGLRKQEALSDVEGLRWHLVGHLQTNKAARAAERFAVMHSVDSLRVAEALSQRRPARSAPMQVLVEVELTGGATRTGVPPQQLESLLPAVAALPGLSLVGLMTIAPLPPSVDSARRCFAQLRELRDRLQSPLGLPLRELSMGMSGDYEVAVEEGATMVRLGRVLFAD